MSFSMDQPMEKHELESHPDFDLQQTVEYQALALAHSRRRSLLIGSLACNHSALSWTPHHMARSVLEDYLEPDSV